MEIKKVCVIGAGVMGSGIAQLIAISGYSVNLVDLSEELLKNIKEKIEQNIDRHYVARNKFSKEEASKILNNIHYYTNIEEAVDKVQLVIEAIYEDMNLKQVLFAKLDSICEKHVILASNTSSLSITDIASQCQHQNRIVGIHFFNPATVMKLIELIKGDKTTDETLEIAKNFSKGLKKTVVTINDSPGFVTSRLIYVLCNEAINMKMEGIASTEDIDTACKLAFNFPMGPLELSDLVGLDIYNNIGEYLNKEFGDKYKPSFLLKKMVNKKRLGRKSRKGFYDY
ncbi:MAG: 3-hydroxyacyl-CoA dehydrogenase family protein [Candidatus Lokiarchaeota archaeon]|nr:3-hydroxyacyl-CoA dehydrogenase family protein [Candidatus Lokiarchaeota archaeon]